MKNQKKGDMKMAKDKKTIAACRVYSGGRVVVQGSGEDVFRMLYACADALSQMGFPMGDVMGSMDMVLHEIDAKMKIAVAEKKVVQE